jgi:hypothetical protein
MKLIDSVAVVIFGTVGGWLGALMDHGNWLGGWSILLSGVGGFFGIWVAYRFRSYF